MDANTQARIFDPFFTTKEVGKGTGLGLSISYGIVKDCRGDIRAESLPEKGARFTLTFPAIHPDDNGGIVLSHDRLDETAATLG